MSTVETYIEMTRLSTYGLVPLEAISSGTIDGAWERVVVRDLKRDIAIGRQPAIDLFDELGINGELTEQHYITAAKYIIRGGKNQSDEN